MPSERAPAKPARGRPRKPVDPSPEARIARLQAELEEAEKVLQAAQATRIAIVGRAVLGHAAKNPEFRRGLAAALRAELTRKSELAAVAALLAGDDNGPPALPG